MQVDHPYAPVEPLRHPLFAEHDLHVFIKREDLAHPFISGNKWRKLRYHLLNAHANNKTKLVTFGGAYSNHLLATAAAGARYRFETIGMVRGDAVKNPVLTLCTWFGMQLYFVDRNAYKDKQLLYRQRYAGDPSAYYIDEGGAGVLGEQGVSELLDDLSEAYDHLLCSVGTGSTFKALVQGVELRKQHTTVTGIAVLKGMSWPDAWLTPYPGSSHRIRNEFHQGGYARTTPALLDFIKHFAAQTGILLDQVYEGKMMMALHSMVTAGEFKPGSKILVLHNGGLSGMLSLL